MRFSLLVVLVGVLIIACEDQKDQLRGVESVEFAPCVEVTTYKCTASAGTGPLHIEIDVGSGVKELITECYYSSDSTVYDTLSSDMPHIETLHSDDSAPFLTLYRDGWSVITFVINGSERFTTTDMEFPYGQILLSLNPPASVPGVSQGCLLYIRAARCQWYDEPIDWEDEGLISRQGRR